MLVLSLMLGMFLVTSPAFAAVPVIDGLLSPNISEWDNNSYEYYLSVTDANEGGITDTYDISTVVLLQELGNGDPAKDGVYFMLTTYATPPSLVDVDQTAVRASLALFTDFDGDGSNPENAQFPFPPDIQIYITNVNSGSPATDPVGSDKVYWCSGAAGSCDSLNGTLIWDAGAATGSTPAGFQYARSLDAIEMFLKTGTFGTPQGVNFPQTFRGCASYDNGTTQPDDVACGQANIIPEPSTMMLLGGSLLGMIGFGKFKFWA